MRQALEKVKYHGYTAIPVIDRNGKYVGTLSEGDLLWAMLSYSAYEDHDREQYRVKNILKGRQNEPVNIAADTKDLFVLAMDQNFIPVTDDRDLFIGIVTRKDILQYFYEETLKMY
jgi:CBS domain-containing protein